MIERAGVKLQHQVPGLKEPSSCTKTDCFLHMKGGKGDCKREGLVYKDTCLTCKALRRGVPVVKLTRMVK